jgi:hypothetical protein
LPRATHSKRGKQE